MTQILGFTFRILLKLENKNNKVKLIISIKIIKKNCNKENLLSRINSIIEYLRNVKLIYKIF